MAQAKVAIDLARPRPLGRTNALLDHEELRFCAGITRIRYEKETAVPVPPEPKGAVPADLPVHAAQQREVEGRRAVHVRARLDDQQHAADLAHGLFEAIRMITARRQEKEILRRNVEGVPELRRRDRRFRKRAVAGFGRQVLGGLQRPALAGAVFVIWILHRECFQGCARPAAGPGASVVFHLSASATCPPSKHCLRAGPASVFACRRTGRSPFRGPDVRPSKATQIAGSIGRLHPRRAQKA